MMFTRGFGTGSGAGGQHRSGLANDQIRELIATEVDTTVLGSIPELFRSIKIMMIELFDDRYASLIETATDVATVAVVVARG